MHVGISDHFIQNRKPGILAIGAHPDDIELGCGATLANLAAKGFHITAIILTAGNAGCPAGISRHDESRLALNRLGCQDLFPFHYQDTRTDHYLDAIINSIGKVIKAQEDAGIRFVRTYTMHDKDRHQDHRATYQASMVACRTIPQILCYETPSCRLSFIPQAFEEFDEKALTNKIAALKFHQSQKHRDYMQPESIRALAQFRGLQAGMNLCEGFVVQKMIL
ncbi:PIG-L deacetylase family protein [Enterobacter sp.]|uniref:PIG-L deacetylase family protein n=1 Tax=Enterobacter sp. TaxID=42895 RepID=UPI00296F6DD4|nr:PIG-L deacetylase family protein [Enterobacter sp.]